jgi:hypothetical protein
MVVLMQWQAPEAKGFYGIGGKVDSSCTLKREKSHGALSERREASCVESESELDMDHMAVVTMLAVPWPDCLPK